MNFACIALLLLLAASGVSYTLRRRTRKSVPHISDFTSFDFVNTWQAPGKHTRSKYVYGSKPKIVAPKGRLETTSAHRQTSAHKHTDNQKPCRLED